MVLRTLYIIGNQLLIVLSLLLVICLRGQDVQAVFAQRHEWLLILMGIHLLLALLFDKYNFARRQGLRATLQPVLLANLTFIGLVSVMFVLIGYLGIPRVLLFGTVGIMTAVELVTGAIIHLFRSQKRKGYTTEQAPKVALEKGVEAPARELSLGHIYQTERGQLIRQAIIEELGREALEYLEKYVPFTESSVVLSVNKRINILNLPAKRAKTIVNLALVNNHRWVNKFFESVNTRLPEDGYYCGVCDTQELRKKRFFRRYSPVLGFVLYCFDFLMVRVAPKLPFTCRIYYAITKGKNRVMSRAEVLGRLYSCGFEVVDERIVGQRFFFVARKVREPHYDMSPSYGPLIRLRRIGKDGRHIGVYKLRTMHPYAEYLQAYIHKQNDLQAGGKFHNDFRVSTLGCIMRVLWLDELPMLVNWFRGDLKLVGVRPLSVHYFNLYSPELQARRTKHKPGLVPPFYSDMPKTLEEIQASEMRYLDAWEKHPFRTDWVYFWKAFYNIVFKHARSK